jgi:hypothetical protein
VCTACVGGNRGEGSGVDGGGPFSMGAAEVGRADSRQCWARAAVDDVAHEQGRARCGWWSGMTWATTGPVAGAWDEQWGFVFDSYFPS